MPLARFKRPSHAVLEQQLGFLETYADLRPDRMTEILAQLEAPTGFLASIGFLRPERSRWTLELLGCAFRLARHVEMRVKHALDCRRPIEFSPQVQPIIVTPGHGTLPSGHATEAFCMAAVLRAVMAANPPASPHYADPAWAIQLYRLAARIAINRTVAGVHFPIDSVAGAMLGLTLGRYLIARCQGNPTISFDSTAFDGDAPGPPSPASTDFSWDALVDPATDAILAVAPWVTLTGQQSDNGEGSALLQWLWGKAAAEWA
jgi:membrane-associated phospholipid phosphatase